MDIEFDPAMPRKPVIFDDDNPEWTDADFARARPLSDFPELAADFPKSKGGRPRGSNEGAGLLARQS
jgi:hypothetical protein